jgi:large subunit ribosomal protein L6
MSRIGKIPIAIPDKVTIDVSGDRVTVKGPLGTLEHEIPKGLVIEKEDGRAHVRSVEDHRRLSALRGLTRAVVANMVTGVSSGFSRTLELVGTGYRVESKGKDALEIDVGFSHKVHFPLPEGISAEVGEKFLRVTIKGADKQLVGQVAADIRRLRPVEPYKGKGIRFEGEAIRMKAGKAGKAAG